MKARPGQTTGGTGPSNGDVPPAGYAPAPDEDSRPKQAHQALIQDLTGLYFLLGATVAGVKPVAGQIIMEKSGDRATELVNACKRNPKALKWLRRITKSSDLTTCVVGHGAMIYAVMIAADRIPLSPRALPMLHALGYDSVIQAKWAEAHQQGAENGYSAEPIAA